MQTITATQLKPNEDKLVCGIKDLINKTKDQALNSVKDKGSELTNKVSEVKQEIKDKVNQTIDELSTKKNELTNEIKQIYQNTSIERARQARPDITLLIEIVIIVGMLVSIYIIWPHLLASKDKLFSKEQYLLAQAQPQNSYSIGEIAKIKVELKAMDDYLKYFDSKPYSIESQGLMDLNRGVVFLPILSFIIIYIVPPFVILYIIWFIITYWRYVIAAIWGWFLMIYRFGTRLIECKLAEKWYIRMITGWSECSPNFSDYFNEWRKQYVDIPVYYEKLKYVQAYYAAKKKYYTIPKRYYIDLPRDRYEIKKEYLRKVYVDRATDVFLRKLLDWYQVYYERPRDELYQYVLGSNQNLAAIWAKIHQTQKQILGLPYESTTPNGQRCSCPATKTPLKLIDNIVTTNLKEAKSDIAVAVNEVKALYDRISEEREQSELSCQNVDQIINHRNQIYLGSVIFILLMGLIIFGYSHVYGTPNWIANWVSPIWYYTTVNLKPVFRAKLPDYSLYLIIIVVFSIIGGILYKIRSI